MHPAEIPLINSDALKEEVRQRIDLVDLVSEHVALKPTGRNFVGLCPFHREKTPSFSVSPSKQIFKCFGCGAGGDVFTFVQLREGATFPEALRILAERAGINYDRVTGRGSAGGADRADLARVNAWAARLFQKAFAGTRAGRVAREYVAGRGIPDEMVRRFGLGWAPDDSNWLLAQARTDKIKESLLQAAGLVQVGSGGDAYCVFRGRLIFPIRDTMNRVIGLGGRTLKEERAKYLNTAQNSLFDKGRNLYGIDLARLTMAETRSAIVVEGYTDCIAAHQYGFTGAVATLGTALTDNQVNLLRRWCDEIILVFDSDAAGVEAADRAVSVALRYNLSVRIAQLSAGKDPCDLLKAQGADEFRSVLKSATDALVFKWDRTCERFAADSGAGRKQAIREFVALVASMARFGTVDAIQRGLIVNQLSKLLALPAEEVHKLLTAATRSGAGATPGAVPTVSRVDPRATLTAPASEGGGGEEAGSWDGEQASLVSILEVLLNEPGYYQVVASVFRPDRIRSGRARRIAEQVVALCESVGEFQLPQVLSRFEDPADAGYLTDLAYQGEQLGNFEAIVCDCRERLERLEPLRRGKEAADELRRAAASTDDQQGAEELERLSRVHGALSGVHGFAPGIPLSTRTDVRQG